MEKSKGEKWNGGKWVPSIKKKRISKKYISVYKKTVKDENGYRKFQREFIWGFSVGCIIIFSIYFFVV
jgi:hypothetical protein